MPTLPLLRGRFYTYAKVQRACRKAIDWTRILFGRISIFRQFNIRNSGVFSFGVLYATGHCAWVGACLLQIGLMIIWLVVPVILLPLSYSGAWSGPHTVKTGPPKHHSSTVETCIANVNIRVYTVDFIMPKGSYHTWNDRYAFRSKRNFIFRKDLTFRNDPSRDGHNSHTHIHNTYTCLVLCRCCSSDLRVPG